DREAAADDSGPDLRRRRRAVRRGRGAAACAGVNYSGPARGTTRALAARSWRRFIMSVFEERGFFWWHDEVVPHGSLVPENHSPGLLKIDDDGLSYLDLDTYLVSSEDQRNGRSRFPILDDPIRINRNIVGISKTTSEYIMLSEIHLYGGRLSIGGVSFENYTAYKCLILNSRPAFDINSAGFHQISMDLSEIAGWFRLGLVKIKKSNGRISLIYKRQRDLLFGTSEGQISITFDDPDIQKDQGNRTEIKSTCTLTWTFANNVGDRSVEQKVRGIQDLFILRTD